MKFFKALLIPLLLAFSSISYSASLADYAENKLVDHLFRATAYSETAPASFEIALYTTSCTDAAVGTEVSAAGYARVSVTRALTSWVGTHGTTTGASSGTNGTISNAAIIQFGAPTANWGSITSFATLDGENPIVCTDLTTAKTVNNGDAAPSFAVGALTIQIDN